MPLYLSQSVFLVGASSAFSSLSRSAFLRRTPLLLTSCCLTMGSHPTHALNMNANKPVEAAVSLLESVYGPVDSPEFPLPMPADEAGLCAGGKQRRYLWTDAFGVLAYLSLAEQTSETQKYNQAANKLIDEVHECLGKPRSNKKADQMTPDTTLSPTGYVGLRIGKTESRQVTDYGMRYDGQYWHYVDKWLLALARAGRIEDGVRIAKSVFPHFFDAGSKGDGWDGGIRWKLSVDATPPPSLQRAHASDDTLVALIVFRMLENNRPSSSPTNLKDEIDMLERSLQYYRPRVTDDPLGWGLEAMYDQFLEGHPRRSALASLQDSALHTSHLSLPFRLYGAMIGARIAGESVAAPSKVDRLIQLSLQHEAQAQARGYEEHSSINRVMLAMSLLCPGALGRRPNDPLIRLE
jgi:hypothetical protein